MPSIYRVTLSLVLFWMFGAMIIGCSLAHQMVFQPTQLEEETKIGEWFKAEELKIKTVDSLEISAAFIPKENSKNLIVYFHGNGGSLKGWIWEYEWFKKLISNFLMIDYRGYGKSQGVPSEEGLYLDAFSAIEYAKTKGFKPENTVVVGRSIGSSIAMKVATKYKVKQVILITPFPDFDYFVNREYWFLLPWLYNPFDFENCVMAKETSQKTLILTAQLDQAIPAKYGRKLKDCFSQKVEYYELEGVGHNNISANPLYGTYLHYSIQEILEK